MRRTYPVAITRSRSCASVRAARVLLFTGLFGITAGPTAIALVTDLVFANDQAIGWSIIGITVPTLLLAAMIAWFSRHYYSRVAGNWSVSLIAQPANAGQDRAST